MTNMIITGTGSCLPDQIITNEDLTKLVDTSDEWIRERTGIGERHISKTETVAELASKACEKALQQAGRKPEEVELILVATCSPELLLPCCACQVQQYLKAENAVAFDLNAACSGFLFALDTAWAYLKAGIYHNALIVGSEVLSKLVDWTDRSTCVLFGDGAGAVFVEQAESGDGLAHGMKSMVQGSDGSLGNALTCLERAVESPFAGQGEELPDAFVRMDGKEIYKFATRRIPDVIEKAVAAAEMTVDDINLFVLHQANVRIIETVAKRLNADIAKFPVNLDRVGNMSSATIPVLLDELNRAGKLCRGQKIVLSGFGAGLTYGASVIIW